MALQRYGTMSALKLQASEDGTSWLRDGWEFAPRDSVFFGKVYKDPRVGVVHTVPTEEKFFWTSTYLISKTQSEEPKIIISSNMGYEAKAPKPICLGSETNDTEARVAPELTGVEMINYGHNFSFGELIGVHVERLEAVEDLNPDILTDEVGVIYANLVYKSPRFGH